MTPLNFSIIKLLLGLIIGILLAHYVSSIRTYCFYLLVVSLSVFIVLYLFFYYNRIKNIWFGFSTLVLVTCLGINSYHINDNRTYDDHYTNVIAKGTSDIAYLLVFKIRERLKPSEFSQKFIAELLSIDTKKTQGKILVYINKDSISRLLKTDDIIATNTTLKNLPEPLNPYQFDYGEYLEQHNIFRQISIEYKSVLILESAKTSISGYASSFRYLINTRLIKAGFGGHELSIINALLLGQRQDIDPKLYSSYAKAGVVHILAVSGLHVGIILLMLNRILLPISYLRFGGLMKASMIVILLWCFAIIAGLSASVTRAVTMFSLLTIAMHLKRPTNTYNTLAISAMILLLVDPKNLFKVGFQMSYSAVVSIVFFQPILFKLWRPKLWILKYIWSIFTVTIAAQLGVLPISIYYFHQFPGLFFIANLCIVPFLGLLLGLGLITICLAILNILPTWIVEPYKFLIQKLNALVQYFSDQNEFLFSNISLDTSEVISLYLFIISIGIFISKKSYKSLKKLLLSLILAQSILIALKIKYSDQRFIVFHKNRESILGYKSNSKLYVYRDLSDKDSITSRCITDYQIGNRIKEVQYEQLKSVFIFKEESIVIVDSLCVYNIKSLQSDYILLRNSPKLHLNRLIDSTQPKMIIADGSNFKSYVRRWKSTCSKRQLPFHYTGEKGAFILK